jgi:hypothetical protein
MCSVRVTPKMTIWMKKSTKNSSGQMYSVNCQQVEGFWHVSAKKHSLDRKINAKLSRGWSGDRRRWSGIFRFCIVADEMSFELDGLLRQPHTIDDVTSHLYDQCRAKIVKILYSVKCTQNHKFTLTNFYLWMDLKNSCKIIKYKVFVLFEIFIATKSDQKYRNENQKIKNHLFWTIL